MTVLDVSPVPVVPRYVCEVCGRPARYQLAGDRACSPHIGAVLDDVLARTPWDGFLPITVKPIGERQ